MATHGDGDVPVVDRSALKRTPPPGRGRRVVIAAIVALGALVLAVLAWAPWRSGPVSDVVPAPSTTVSVPTDPGVAADGPVAPLTGVVVPPEREADLLGPALVAKIDGAPEAMAQLGLDSADVVIEVRVEWISRYLGVWHSSVPDSMGPVRSARTTDPDLLALFGHPLFSYSGGNPGVLAALRGSDWFTDVGHDAVPAAYTRDRQRRAPHNLYAATGPLFASGDDEIAAPEPLFNYAEVDSGGFDPATMGEPTPGFAVDVGSRARFVWDPDRAGWRRWAHGRPHRTPAGEQLATTNVVVLEVDHVPSPADRASPEAVTVGNGDALVYAAGRVQRGTWDRGGRSMLWELSGDDGSPMQLLPGTTWIVLAGEAPVELSSAAAAELLAEALQPGA